MVIKLGEYITINNGRKIIYVPDAMTKEEVIKKEGG